MKITELKAKNKTSKYSILIGKNISNILNKKIRLMFPKADKIALIVDSNVPKKFIAKIKKSLKGKKIFIFIYHPSESSKSFNFVNSILDKLLKNKFNRSDIVIGMGGGILGDISGFISSIFKRGINFINVPTTLLAQVDASIGGKTGINSKYGKNLIGAFYQPKLVLTDTLFLKSLSKRQMICGYAEILKHAIINNKKFFYWLKKNTQKILNKTDDKSLIYAIKKSTQIKLNFVNKDVNENNLRMALNFGHTFAHGIEAANHYSSKINHGEAVLMGMIIAIKISVYKKICSQKISNEILKIYKDNNLNYDINKFYPNKKKYKILDYLQNDKKNNDNKINFILLKNIGKTTQPGKYKLSMNEVKSNFEKFI